MLVLKFEKKSEENTSSDSDNSEGEEERRHRHKLIQQQQAGPTQKIIVGRAPSTKRQAPSPPGKPQIVRRVVSSDRDEPRTVQHNVRRVASSDRGLQHPPQRRAPVNRRSSVDALDSSYSESEGLNGDNNDQVFELTIVTKCNSEKHTIYQLIKIFHFVKFIIFMFLIQVDLVPKLTIGPFLTLSVYRNGPNLKSYLF